MNGTHLHLLLNHFPIIGTLVACGLMLWAIISNNAKLKDITAVIIIIMAVFGFIADQTGESAEHALKGYAGVTRAAMHAHEEAAGPAMIIHIIAALLCGAYLWLSYKKLPMRKTLYLVCFGASVLAFGAMARAGYLGGKIRHAQEIDGLVAAPATTGVALPNAEDND